MPLARRIALLLVVTPLGGCPEVTSSPREELVEEVGGAPKRQLDAVQSRLDSSTQRMQERLELAE